LPVLVAVLQNPKESADARREAAFAIGAIGNAGAIGALRSQTAASDYYLIEICNDAIRRIESTESPRNP
jgi:HEAT repeat protein